MTQGTPQKIETPPAVDLKGFYEATPPGKVAAVTQHVRQENSYFFLDNPDIMLHCTKESCGGPRLFECTSSRHVVDGTPRDHFVKYRCKNCEEYTKIFAVQVNVDNIGKFGKIIKYGEMPSFGPPTPSRLITLLGPEKEYFLKGRRSENQGLGIAAFAYYRRVIESQRNRIFDEIIRVSKALSASKELLEELEKAKKETQFSKAVSVIKHAIPQALMINGHNPLTLLHSALSDGLHDQADEHCLSVATHIRVVLTEFVERLSQALKDDSELNAAVSTLLSLKSSKEK